MAERRAKDKGKGKLFEKPIPRKPRSSLKGKGAPSLAKTLEVIVISSSSSDSEEGFVEEATPSSSRPTIRPEKVSSEKEIPSSSRPTIRPEKVSSEKEIPSSSRPTIRPEKVSSEKEAPSSSKPTIPPKKETKQEVKLPPGAKLLMDCEAADILQTIHAKLGSLNVPEIKIPKSFEKALQYSEDTVQYTDVKSIKLSLEGLKKEHKATDWEICMLANTCPDTLEEAYALIPSLKDKKDSIDNPLEIVLTTLAMFKDVDFTFHP